MSSLTATFAEAAFARKDELDIAGTYQGRAPAADPAKRTFTLILAEDGTARLTTLYIGKESATAQGHWRRNRTQLVLTFDPIGGNEPFRPIVFRYHDRTLRAIGWDRNEWGSTGPPILTRGDTGGNTPRAGF